MTEGGGERDPNKSGGEGFEVVCCRGEGCEEAVPEGEGAL